MSDQENPIVKNSLENSPTNVTGNLRVGNDYTYYHLSSAPFALSSYHIFLEKTKHDLLDKEDTIPCFDCHQTQITEFWQNPRKQILIIYGADESGKTHLLRNMILDASQNGWRCLGLESHSMGTTPTIELGIQNQLLLFKDDMQWQRSDFLQSVLTFVDAHPHVRLILTLHIAKVKDVKEIIGGFKDLPGKCCDVQLGKWSHDDLLKIFRHSVGTNAETVQYENEIVRQFPNPYLLKFFGEVKRENIQLDVVGVSRNFTGKIRMVFETCLQPDLNIEKVPDFVMKLILGLFSSEQIEKTAEDLGIGLKVLVGILNRLEEAEVVIKYWDDWQIYPEVKGDFYIASIIESKRPDEVAAFLHPYLQYGEQKIVWKLSESLKYLPEKSQTTLLNYFCLLLNIWIEEIRRRNISADVQLLRSATKMLSLNKITGAEKVVDIACTFVTISLYHLTRQNFDRYDYLGLTEYAFFTRELIDIKDKRNDCLSLIEALWKINCKNLASLKNDSFSIKNVDQVVENVH